MWTNPQVAKRVIVHKLVNLLLKDMNDFAAFNRVYAKYFNEKPARSCVGISALPKGALCEVEVIAEL